MSKVFAELLRPLKINVLGYTFNLVYNGFKCTEKKHKCHVKDCKVQISAFFLHT